MSDPTAPSGPPPATPPSGHGIVAPEAHGVPAGRSRVPWRPWEAVVTGVLGLLAAIVLIAGVTIALTSAGTALDDLDALLPYAIAGQAVAVAGLVLLWVGARYGRAGLVALYRPGPRAMAAWTVALLAAAIGATWVLVFQFGVGSLIEALWPGVLPEVQTGFRELAEAGGARLLLLFLAAGVVAPLWEELFFRGMLFTALDRRFGFWPGALVSSLVFGLIHVEGTVVGSAYLVAQLFLLGLMACWLLRRTGTLLAPVVLHAAHNAVAVAALALLS